ANETLGTVVAGVGDMNGDGIDDLAVSAPGAWVLTSNGQPDRSGDVLIVFGRDAVSGGAFPATLDRSVLDGHGGFVFRGGAGDEVGFSLAGAGDINADGLADVIAGAPSYGPPNRPSVGTAYVVYGSDNGGAPDPLVLADDLDGTQGFAVRGSYGSHGWSVAGGGDLNGDGIDDLLSGVPDQFGYAHAVWGSDTATSGDFPPYFSAWSGVGPTLGTVLYAANQYWYTGRSVDFIGDINNDGVDDIAIGAPHATPGSWYGDSTNPFYRSGQLYIVYGRDLDPCRAADVNGDGLVNGGDFNAWVISFNTQSPLCDQNRDGTCTPSDFNAWVINFNAGC
ncbi:MAG: integrin alpha, partial [Planctomycetota bacterium]